MNTIRLTDKEIGSKPVATTKFVVTQPENVEGAQKEAVRRVGLTEIVNLVLSAGIASEFSESATYASSDYVTYNGELYRFKAAHPAGAWDVSHVDKVELMDEIQKALGTDKTLTQENVPADAKAVGTEIGEVKDALDNLDIETDTTLSVSGKPADSKKVGDEITNLKANLNKTAKFKSLVFMNLFDPTTIISGGYYGNNGKITADANSYYNEAYISIESDELYSYGGTSTSIQICTYDSTKTFIERINSTAPILNHQFNSNVAFIRTSSYRQDYSDFVFAKSDDYEHISASNPIMIDGDKITSIEFDTDKSLSVPDKAADAKAVGDAINTVNDDINAVADNLSEVEDIFFTSGGQISFPTTFNGAIDIKSIAGSILTGGHNIVDYIGLADGVYTLNGITFSVNGNEITISGTATGGVYFNLDIGTIASTSAGLNGETDYSLPAIEYNVGAIFDGIASGVTFGVRSRVSGNIGVAGKNTPSFTATYDHATWGHLYIYVANNTALPDGGKLYIGIVPSSVSNPLSFYSENNAITEISNIGTATLDVYSIASGAVEAYATNKLVAKYKKKHLRYVQGSGVDRSTERLEIYIPSIVGYIRYDFLHTVYAERHADVWRIGYAYAVDDNFEERFALTTQGEWECALHLKDRSDFSGGYAHGDEIIENIVFFVDNVPVDITKYTTYTFFDKLDIVQVSDLYDPNDGETIIAKHGSKHVFGDSEVRISQSIIWKVSETLTWCYLAMFPPAKTVTNKLYTNKDFNIINVDGTTTSIKNATKCSIYSADSAFMADFNIDEYPKGIDNTADYFMTTDNNGGIYNKCYYVISGVGNPVTAIDEEWKSETIYKLDVGK